MEAILAECVNNSLRQLMYKNAIFICERLCAEFSSEANLQLLAGCYLQNKQPYSAYHILKGTQMAQSRYLFALACFELGLLSEAEGALCPANEPGLEVPNGAAGHYLIGLIYRFTDRRKNAVLHFKKALLQDPLMWTAYEELCVLGAADEANNVFSESAALSIQKKFMNLASCSRNSNVEDSSPSHVKQMHVHNNRDIPNNCPVGPSFGTAIQSTSNGPTNSVFYNTPSPVTTQVSVAPPPVYRNMQPISQNQSAPCVDTSPKLVVNSNAQALRRKFVDEGKLRKISGRLFSDSGPRRSTRVAADSAAYSSVTMASGNNAKYLGGSKLSAAALRSVTLRKGQSWGNENCDEAQLNEGLEDFRPTGALNLNTSSADGRLGESDGASLTVGGVFLSPSGIFSGALEVINLLRTFGEGYRLACLYKCQDALDAFAKLLPKHYNTGWVLSQVGRAYFELIDYLEADRAFSLARQVSPYSLEGMDVYSTVLYHLKEDMKLSYLAQELISTDRLAPQAWCAMGNCYSLQKDHETALKNFQRAVQLNSRFAYAHTLCGHEYVTLEDFEDGIRCYQNALKTDWRHYNAWYGLGMAYLRKEKFEFSEHHFRMAYQINPRSSVILTYLGISLHALKRNEEALDMIERAIVADTKNPLPMYQKANILVSMDDLDEALEVLEDLKEYAPRESSVFTLMGRIYKRKNRHDRAMLCFGIALDMKPSTTDVATIKAAMEKLHVPDDLEDSIANI